jgi:hypothetical protein
LIKKPTLRTGTDTLHSFDRTRPFSLGVLDMGGQHGQMKGRAVFTSPGTVPPLKPHPLLLSAPVTSLNLTAPIPAGEQRSVPARIPVFSCFIPSGKQGVRETRYNRARYGLRGVPVRSGPVRVQHSRMKRMAVLRVLPLSDLCDPPRRMTRV